MFGTRQLLRLGIALAAALLVACGSGSAGAPDPEYQRLASAGTVEPGTELEEEILAKLPDMEPGVRVEVGGGAAIAGREYAAASGRRCRELTIETGRGGQPASRLACLVDDAWSFVPEVLAPEAAAQQPGATAEAGGGGP